MTIFFINNDGGGFADRIHVSEGTTVASLFAEKMPGRKAVDFLIRVNRQPAVADQPPQTRRPRFDYPNKNRGGLCSVVSVP